MNSITQEVAIDDAIENATAVPRPHQHMPSLDGLRGIAILLVVISHLGGSISGEFSLSNRLLNWSELGWTGVDLFFVLSGFLITGILHDAKEQPKFFRNFYARRALRIFPLYYIAILVVILMTPLLVRLNLQGTANPAWLSIYATNFVISARGPGAFGVLDHFWSLAVEEHFYLVWPAIVFFLDRKKLLIVAAGACLVAPLLRIGTMNAAGELPFAAYMATPMRMDSLAAGAFIALLARGPKGMTGMLRPAMIIAPAAILAFLAMVIARKSKVPLDAVLGIYGLTTLWVACGATLILALNWQPLKTALSAPVLRWFGKYSYGMYVWHPIVFILVFHNDIARGIRGGNGPMEVFLSSVIGLAAMFAITLASWHVWEKQFLKMKSRFA